MRKANQEELGLGLDPSKYAKKPWNPYDFIGGKRDSSQITIEPEIVSGFEITPEIEAMYQNAKPWDISDVKSNEVVKNPELYQEFVEASRANPEMAELLDRNYNDALNATWEDIEGGEIVPPKVQTSLFRDWLNDELLKKQKTP